MLEFHSLLTAERVAAAVFAGFSAYILLSVIFIFVLSRRPAMMSFKTYKYICSLGPGVPIDQVAQDVEMLTQVGFHDPNYRVWFNEVIKSGQITHLERASFACACNSVLDTELERQEGLIADAIDVVQAKNSPLEFIYFVRAIVPNPKGEPSHFTYEGALERSSPIDFEKDMDSIRSGLSDHVLQKTGVYCEPYSFQIASIDPLPVKKANSPNPMK